MNLNATLIIQSLVFLILGWVTMKFVWPPLIAAIEARQRKISEGLISAEKAEKSLAEAKASATDIIKEARVQANKIVEQANRRSNEVVEEARGTAIAEGQRLLADARIVRNRAKVDACIGNARAMLEIDDFAGLLWSFVDGHTIVNGWRHMDQIPASTDASEAMSRELRRRGFRFVGPTICYAFMQSAGMVDDHVVGCFRHGVAATEGDGPG